MSKRGNLLYSLLSEFKMLTWVTTDHGINSFTNGFWPGNDWKQLGSLEPPEKSRVCFIYFSERKPSSVNEYPLVTEI